MRTSCVWAALIGRAAVKSVRSGQGSVHRLGTCESVFPTVPNTFYQTGQFSGRHQASEKKPFPNWRPRYSQSSPETPQPGLSWALGRDPPTGLCGMPSCLEAPAVTCGDYLTAGREAGRAALLYCAPLPNKAGSPPDSSIADSHRRPIIPSCARCTALLPMHGGQALHACNSIRGYVTATVSISRHLSIYEPH